MNRGLLFWIVMILSLLFGVWHYWPTGGWSAVGPLGMTVLVWVLLALLGWEVFGPAVK